MRAIPLVRSSSLRPLLVFLSRTPGLLPPLLERACGAAAESDLPIPLAVGGMLFEQAERATGLSDVGLRVGRASRVDEIGAFGRAIRSQPTLGAALAIAVQRSERFNTGERFWLDERGDLVWFCRWHTPRLLHGRQAVSDYSLMLMLDVIRLAGGPAWRPWEIHLEGARPRHGREIEDLADHAVFYAEPFAAVVFPRDLLSLPFPPSHGAGAQPVHAVQPRLPSDFEGSVKQAVAGLLHLGRVDLSALAEAAGTSERSLQRRLSESGLCFARLLDQARFERATQLLSRESARVVDVAAELAYTDAANFSRAFRRWTGGQTPQQFRAAATAAQDSWRLRQGPIELRTRGSSSDASAIARRAGA